MKKIFIDYSIEDQTASVVIEGNDFVHIVKSLRHTSGDKLLLGDLSGNEYSAYIDKIGKENLTLKIEGLSLKSRKKNSFITLYFPVLKSDKSEFILQKCTEIGVDCFIPLITENTIVKLDDKVDKKLKRWEVIIKEAAMQSGREIIPELLSPVKISEIDNIAENEIGVICDIGGENIGGSVLFKKQFTSIKSAVGPEGDFTSKEIQTLLDKGFTPINLSDNILRSETACIYISTILSLRSMGEI